MNNNINNNNNTKNINTTTENNKADDNARDEASTQALSYAKTQCEAKVTASPWGSQTATPHFGRRTQRQSASGVWRKLQIGQLYLVSCVCVCVCVCVSVCCVERG